MKRYLPLVVSLLIAALTSACDRPTDPPPGAADDGSGTPAPAAEAPDGSGAEPSATEATAPGTAPETDTQTGADTEPAAQPESSLAPPALAGLMRRIGYAEASEADLDAFAHLPPGATGDAGTFGSGEATVRVALIAYPNARYVAPHLNDVHERERVLPSPREAAVAHDRWILHVMARDHASARAVADAAADALGWER